MRLIENIEDNCILYSKPMAEALSKLNSVEPKVLFVVDEGQHLIGTATDGDIRRAILSGADVNSNIASFANTLPVVISDDNVPDLDEAERITVKLGISAIPVTDETGHVKGMLTDWVGRSIIKSKIDVPVVMMAGGKGTRLYPFTKILPKPLIPIDGVPISERIIDGFCELGCNVFHVIVNYKKNMIKSYFNDTFHDYSIMFYDENEPLGTGGGLKLVEKEIDGTFILTNCDIIIMDDIEEILRHHKNNANSVTMVCSLKEYEIPYGVVNSNDEGVIESLDEKPKLSFLTNTGYYILERDVFDFIKPNEKIGMPDIVMRMKRAGYRTGVYPISETSWLDMGQFDTMENMERRIREMLH